VECVETPGGLEGRRVECVETPGGLEGGSRWPPGRREEASLKNAHFLKDVPCETLLRAIRWSVVFRLSRFVVFPAAPRSRSPWVCCCRLMCCFRFGVLSDTTREWTPTPSQTQTSPKVFFGAGPGVTRRKQPGMMRCGRLVIGCAALCGGFRSLVEISRVRAPACGPRLVSRWPGPRTPKYSAKILCSFFC
jgi:hypothetical protein